QTSGAFCEKAQLERLDLEEFRVRVGLGDPFGHALERRLQRTHSVVAQRRLAEQQAIDRRDLLLIRLGGQRLDREIAAEIPLDLAARERRCAEKREGPAHASFSQKSARAARLRNPAAPRRSFRRSRCTARGSRAWPEGSTLPTSGSRRRR